MFCTYNFNCCALHCCLLPNHSRLYHIGFWLRINVNLANGINRRTGCRSIRVKRTRKLTTSVQSSRVVQFVTLQFYSVFSLPGSPRTSGCAPVHLQLAILESSDQAPKQPLHLQLIDLISIQVNKGNSDSAFTMQNVLFLYHKISYSRWLSQCSDDALGVWSRVTFCEWNHSASSLSNYAAIINVALKLFWWIISSELRC